MSKRLQVWSTAVIIKGVQRCVIVAAPSGKEAARLFGIKYGVLATYGGKTGNPEQIAIAMSKPGTVFATKDMNYPHIYKAIRPLATKAKPEASNA